MKLLVPGTPRWLGLAAVALLGCFGDDDPSSRVPRGPVAPQPPGGSRDAGTAPARSPSPAGASPSGPAAPAMSLPAVPVPPPEPDRPWDSCSSQDPNPWPWRSDALGKWGENPALVPDFTFKQERRAPKMPDADRHMRGLGRTTPKETLSKPLTGALLICHVETYPRHGLLPTFYRYKLQGPNPARHNCGGDWDPLNGPDVLLRFRFRDEYPIALFGPEDHWGFFVSIPNIALTVGDSLAVKLWDRDSGTYLNGNINDRKNEYMGEARLKFDGSLPFTLRSEFFTLRCNAMRAPQTRARAQSWLDQLDRQLTAARDWRPDPNSWDYGDNGAAARVADEFGRGIYRYPAGFLGWDAPEIQSRLPLVSALVEQDTKKRRERTSELLQKAPPIPSGDYRLDGDRGILHFTAAKCSGGACTVQAGVGARELKNLCPQPEAKPRVRVAGIDASGKFSAARIESEKAGVWTPCPAALGVASATAVRFTLSGGSVLLWLGGAGKAAAFKLPGT